MTNEKVSVIMSCYKEKKEWLNLSIESILGQTYQNIEFLIIVDDPDNAELKNIIYRYAMKDNRIRVCENKKNMGLVYSLNKGLEMSTGKYIARMDADDISENRRIEEELNHLKKYNLDLVGSDIVAIDENSDIMPGVAAQMPVSNQYIKYILRYKSCLMHPTWLGKKEIFETMSGYREINYCEDYDFLLRAVLSGARLGNIPEPLLKYRYNFLGISRQNKAEQRCITYFLGRNRKVIDVLSTATINSFPVSTEGKKEIREMKEYFLISKIALQNKMNGDYRKLLKTCIKILRTKYGRRNAYIIFITKFLIKLDRREILNKEVQATMVKEIY